MSQNTHPLLGKHNKKLHVVVTGQESCIKLKSLGHYGTDLDRAKRKETARRGPLDRQIIDSNPSAKLDDTTSVLFLHEAFFLAYALGCLGIAQDEDNGANYETLSLRSCWKEFRRCQAESNNQLDFAIEYGVYHYLRTIGWVVKPGENYGANFLLYREAPSIDHAPYAVIIFDDTSLDERLYNWTSLLTFHRVVQSVSKKLVIAYVRKECSSFDEPSCIKGLKITTRIFQGHADTPSRTGDSSIPDL